MMYSAKALTASCLISMLVMGSDFVIHRLTPSDRAVQHGLGREEGEVVEDAMVFRSLQSHLNFVGDEVQVFEAGKVNQTCYSRRGRFIECVSALNAPREAFCRLGIEGGGCRGTALALLRGRLCKPPLATYIVALVPASTTLTPPLPWPWSRGPRGIWEDSAEREPGGIAQEGMAATDCRRPGFWDARRLIIP